MTNSSAGDQDYNTGQATSGDLFKDMKQIEKKQDGVCPTCGRCPTCGHRRYTQPYYPPYYPYWYQTHPYWITYGTIY